MTRHLISTRHLERNDLYRLWQMATEERAANTNPLSQTVSLLFESPSTRTKFGFELAALELGARTIDLNGSTSRLASGESLEDSLHTMQQMSEHITVVRTRQALATMDLDGMRVINAGDAMEHPTQALVDLFSIATLMNQSLRDLGDFTLYCCIGQGGPLRPIVSLAWLLETLGRGRILLFAEQDLPELNLPRLSKVCKWSPSISDASGNPAFGYIVESFSAQGNLQRSDWVAERLKEMADLPNLHPLPRLEAKELTIKDSTPGNAVSTQLKLQIPVKKSTLRWIAEDR